MIEVQNLHKQFGSVAALRGLSFEARDGSITGLLGSNGAGKTTALRIMAGVLQPASGRVKIRGVAGLDDGRQIVGALLDQTGLYGRLTARENLMYFGRLRGMPDDVLERRTAELIDILGLQQIAGRRAAGFSQGERMKTALARAIIHSPRNLLLDEPTNGLDVPAVRSLRSFLLRLRDAGCCIVFSSHILEETRALCDHVVIVSRGACVAEGSPDELCRQAGGGNLEDALMTLTGEGEAQPC